MESAESKAFVDTLYRKVLLTVKASNGIPSEEDDYHYHCKYNRSFATHVNATSKQIQDLVWKLIKQNDIERKYSSKSRNQDTSQLDNEEDDDVDEHEKELFDGPEPKSKITDLVDSLLDEASKQLDNFENGTKPTEQNTTTTLENKPLDFRNSKKKMYEESIGANITKNDTQSRSNTSKTSSKPQDLFDEKIDNSDTPFVCKLREKPHSIMEDSTEDQNMEDGEPYHPYRQEIISLKYQDWQLEPSIAPFTAIPLDQAKYNWVSTPEKLDELIKVLSLPANQVIAIDLEHHHYHSYLGLTCLMQISIADQDWLVDTLALRSKLQVLNHVFADPTKLKVLHGADMDILWLQRDLGLYIVNMFDTGQAARLLQYPRYSLAYLLKRHVGIDADKQYQLADWRARPLEKNMIKYAREDTRYLLYIYDQLKTELMEQDQQSRSSLLFQCLKNSNSLCLQVYTKPEVTIDDCEALADKMKSSVGLVELTPVQQSVFQLLFFWRDRIAREQDESTGFVLPNQLLIKITKYLPVKSEQLARTCHPLPVMVRKYAHELTTMIANEKAKQATFAEKQTPPIVQDLFETPQKKNSTDLNMNISDYSTFDGGDGSSSSSNSKKDIIMESPVLGNIKQLCEYAGWQSGKRKAKCIDEDVQMKHQASPGGLRLCFSDFPLCSSSITNTSTTSLTTDGIVNLQKVNQLVEQTSLALEKSGGSFVDGMEIVEPTPKKNSKQEETLEELNESIPQSISEIYQLSNKNKKRHKGQEIKSKLETRKILPLSNVKEKAEDFMKEIGWIQADKKEEEQEIKQENNSPEKKEFKAFDYATVSQQFMGENGSKMDFLNPKKEEKTNSFHKKEQKRGYNPFIAMRAPNIGTEPTGAKKPMKKMHHMPRSATFR